MEQRAAKRVKGTDATETSGGRRAAKRDNGMDAAETSSV